MNYNTTIKSFLVTSLAVIVVAQVPVAHAAGTASLTMVPSASSTTVGKTISVAIYENGTNVSVVTAGVTYDASKLTCTAVDASGSAFVNGISATCGGGSATISRYVAPGTVGLNGSVLVGRLNFSAIATGSAVLSFTSSTQIASAGVNTWNGLTSGTSISVSAAPVASPAPQVPTSSSATSTTAKRVPSTASNKKSVTVTTTRANTSTQPKSSSTNTNTTATVLGARKTNTPKKAITATAIPLKTSKRSNYIPLFTILLVLLFAGAFVYYANKRNTDKKANHHQGK